MRSSTVLSVSVTRSEAVVWCQRRFDVEVLHLGMISQFFFVSTVVGLAEVILGPAFFASPTRKSCISWRLGSGILSVEDRLGN